MTGSVMRESIACTVQPWSHHLGHGCGTPIAPGLVGQVSDDGGGQRASRSGWASLSLSSIMVLLSDVGAAWTTSESRLVSWPTDLLPRHRPVAPSPTCFGESSEGSRERAR